MAVRFNQSPNVISEISILRRWLACDGHYLPQTSDRFHDKLHWRLNKDKIQSSISAGLIAVCLSAHKL